jgi:hypothetical protein
MVLLKMLMLVRNKDRHADPIGGSLVSSQLRLRCQGDDWSERYICRTAPQISLVFEVCHFSL